jgi:hypothetical protein
MTYACVSLAARGYQVRPVPEAVELVKWHFGSLSDEAEDDYIKAKVNELSKASVDARGASPAHLKRLQDVTYDELHPVAGMTGCHVCLTAHWDCKADYNAELHSLSKFLKFETIESDVSGEAHSDLAWVTEPLLPTPEDCRVMTAVILAAHRFVKEHERDQ